MLSVLLFFLMMVNFCEVSAQPLRTSRVQFVQLKWQNFAITSAMKSSAAMCVTLISNLPPYACEEFATSTFSKLVFASMFPWWRQQVQTAAADVSDWLLQILSQKLWQVALASCNCWKCSSCLLPDGLTSPNSAMTCWVFSIEPVVLSDACLWSNSLPLRHSFGFKISKWKHKHRKQPQKSLRWIRKHIILKISFSHYFPTHRVTEVSNTIWK